MIKLYDNNYLLIISASVSEAWEPLVKTDAPSCTNAGVFGIILITLDFGGRISSIDGIDTPRATEAISGLLEDTVLLISCKTLGIICGLTDKRMISDADAVSLLSYVVLAPNSFWKILICI